MTMLFSCTCKNYPGMETCSGHFFAETEAVVIQHMELHASIALHENPTAWSAEDWEYLKGLNRAEVIIN